MNTSRSVLIAIVVVMALCVSPVMAQQKRVSPHETISTLIGAAVASRSLIRPREGPMHNPLEDASKSPAPVVVP